MSVVGLRVAAFGGRVLFCQRQCKFIMRTKGLSPTPLTVRARLPNQHWPREAMPSQKILRQQPSDPTLQCSVQDPFPPATILILLNTKGTISIHFLSFIFLMKVPANQVELK
jgi:hypothetical protein